MNQHEASVAVFTHWNSLWPALSGNVPWTPDNIVMPEGAAYFARVGLISLDSEQRTLGPPGRRKWDHTGLIEVRLSGPINEGRGPLDLLAGHVRTIFQGVRIGSTTSEQGIVTHATALSELRRDTQATSRWILTCSTDYSFQEIA